MCHNKHQSPNTTARGLLITTGSTAAPNLSLHYFYPILIQFEGAEVAFDVFPPSPPLLKETKNSAMLKKFPEPKREKGGFKPRQRRKS